MLEKFKKHINQNLPFLVNSKLLLAISGGIDSVILAHLLHEMQLNYSLAHCNFKLRYEHSDKDAVFVADIATELGVGFHTIEFETTSYAEEKKLSTQMAARELRYNWFDELILKHDYDYVLTAHHTNDNIETVLINLTRGSSLQGLTGIPEINGNIVRPLLPFTRAEIEQYTIVNNISWREDESNQSTKYFRNKIRHEVVPVLEKLNPSVLETFNTHLSYLKLEKKVLDNHFEKVKNEVSFLEGDLFKINIKKLKKHIEYKAYLYYMLKGCLFTEWSDIEGLMSGQSGKYVNSKTHRLIKDRDFLLLEEKSLHLQQLNIEINKNVTKINTPINLSFNFVNQVGSLTKNIIYVNGDILEYPLHLRKKNEGDFFFPFGMKGKKKISKYFKDEKMSLIDKENSWLLCDAKGVVIWVVGRRSDDRYSVTQTTNKILKITLN
ncbi:MAG: tRNA lysidine(34) synthetase TilS [Kordia sp.]|nr:MAG: tRNA lysidine(34) synthetase TilS [Kordia sp.]